MKTKTIVAITFVLVVLTTSIYLFQRVNERTVKKHKKLTQDSTINNTGSGEDAVSLGSVRKLLPSTWDVSLVSINGRAAFKIVTPDMETTGSKYGSSFGGRSKQRLEIFITILPRFCSAFINEINSHNLSVSNELGNSSDGIELEKIDEPIFIGRHYGFNIDFLPRVPVNEHDSKIVLDAVNKVVKTWDIEVLNPGNSKRTVDNYLRAILNGK